MVSKNVARFFLTAKIHKVLRKVTQGLYVFRYKSLGVAQVPQGLWFLGLWGHLGHVPGVVKVPRASAFGNCVHLKDFQLLYRTTGQSHVIHIYLL
jgi:hypothetical protein